MNEALGGALPSSYMGNKHSGELLAKDTSITVLKVEFPTPPLDKMTKLSDIDEIGAGVKRFKVVVRYASLYDEQFTFESDCP
jgi:hypothetical protein